MLKLTYTINSFSLERLDESLEDWVNVRVMLGLRLATKIYLEPSTASFLLPTEVSHLADLEKAAKENFLELCRCDAEYFEIVLKGFWLTSDSESEVGVFACALPQSTELLLHQLSQSERFCKV